MELSRNFSMVTNSCLFLIVWWVINLKTNLGYRESRWVPLLMYMKLPRSFLFQEDKNSIIVVFIYEKIAPNCKTVVNCVRDVAKDYPQVKFCTIEATSVGLSKHFKISGVPAILTYKGGELLASFVRITETLGDDFYSSDLESFLIENQILVRSCYLL